MTDEITQNDCQGEGPELVERAEISSLREQLTEAREIIGAAHDYLSCDWFPHKSRNGNDKAAIEARARAFLKGETDDA